MKIRNKNRFLHLRLKRYDSGASLTEFVIVTPIAILFVLGIIQSGLVYMAKLTLNNVTFLAARHGANKEGDKTEISNSIAKGLIPFYIDATSQPSFSSMGLAFAEAKVKLALPWNKLEILSPSQEMFDTFGITSTSTGTGTTGKYIPNDNLEYRDASPRAAGSGQISIRDANILKIKFTYGYDISKIPLMGTIVNNIMCSGLTNSVKAWGGGGLGTVVPDSNCLLYYSMKRVPIVSYATVQMQSNANETGVISGSTPSPSPSPTPTPTPAPTPSPSPSPTPGPTPSPNPSPTPGPVPAPTPTDPSTTCP
jgi:TadE-like protein